MKCCIQNAILNRKELLKHPVIPHMVTPPIMKCNQIKMRDYMDRRVTPPSRLPHLPGVPHLHVNRP